MLSGLVLTAIASLDGAEFNRLGCCPECGGAVTGYDRKSRIFATITEGDTVREIRVTVKRFTCTACGKVVSADAPFYPDTRVGSPVVDFCILLSRSMPVSRTATILEAMGILVDRGSARNYAMRDFGPIETTEMFGVRIPRSVLGLSLLASRNFEGGPVPGAEALLACGFPSAARAAPDLPLPEKRDKRDKEEQKEERQADQE